MIALLIVVALMWWRFWQVFRSARPATRANVAAAERRTRGAMKVSARQDDLDQLPATAPAWTALDELQLTRLLQASTPPEAATNSTDEDVIREP